MTVDTDLFVKTWSESPFIEDIAETLGVSIPTVKTRSKNLGLAIKPSWGKAPYSRQSFYEAWSGSNSIEEVKTALGLNSVRGLAEKAHALDLKTLPLKTPPRAKVEAVSVHSLKEAWEINSCVQDVARSLKLPTSTSSLKSLEKIAQDLKLEAKPRLAQTEEEVNAGDLIKDWVDWHREKFFISPLKSEIDVVAKPLREMLAAGYGEAELQAGLIKYSMTHLSGKHAGAIQFKEFVIQARNESNAHSHQIAQAAQNILDPLQERVW